VEVVGSVLGGEQAVATLPGIELGVDPVGVSHGVEPEAQEAEPVPGRLAGEGCVVGPEPNHGGRDAGPDGGVDLDALGVAAQELAPGAEALVPLHVLALALDAPVPDTETGIVRGLDGESVDDGLQLFARGVDEIGEAASRRIRATSCSIP